jgi:hypothetical protein
LQTCGTKATRCGTVLNALIDTARFVEVLRREYLFKALRWVQGWDCGSPHEKKAFPCGWEGAVMTPREPFSKVFQQQPQPAAVSRMAMNMHKHWKVFFQDELGPLPELVYAQVTKLQDSMQTFTA